MQSESRNEEERIIPLGLTPDEAKGWYFHHVLRPPIVKGISALTIASITILSALTLLEPYLESTLLFRLIVQNPLYVAAGFLLFYGVDSLALVTSRGNGRMQRLYRLVIEANRSINKFGVMTFVIAAALLAYWHMPANFDLALLSENSQTEMYLTLLGVGGLVYVGSTVLTKSMRRLAPIIVGKGMGLFGAFLLLTTSQLYRGYALGEQVQVGVAMVVMMALIDLTILPLWLYSYFR